MALTENGYEVKRFETVSPELKEDLRTNLDPNLDTSTTSVAGVITDIFAAEIVDLYNYGQAIYDSFNIDKAEGKALDDLVALIGVTRINATATSGPVHLTGSLTTSIPAGTLFSNPNTLNRYSLDNAVTLSNLNCTKIKLYPAFLESNRYYLITVSGEFHGSYFNDSPPRSAVVQQIVTALTMISDGSYTATNVNDEFIVVEFTNPLLPSTVTFSDQFTVEEVTGLGNVTGVTVGEVVEPINSVTKIVTPVSGLTSVTNPVDLTTGRADEPDEELRVRAKLSTRIAGTATVPAIESSLRQVAGVTQAFVIENIDILTDVDGRPPKSYQCIVVGGNDADIGQTVWDTKPAGIETYGDTTVVVVDDNGNDQIVKFSRPINKYVHARMTYEIYNEEIFPSDGEDLIAQAIVDTGNSLDVGEDVIIQRFYGPIYTAVSGIQLINLEMAVTDNPTDTPSSWVTTYIPIGSTQIAAFDLTRIDVSSV